MKNTYDNLIGCHIDGAVPRSQRERVLALADLYLNVAHIERKPIPLDLYTICLCPDCESKEDEDLYYDEIEEDLITSIEGLLPEHLMLLRECGDVIITNETE